MEESTVKLGIASFSNPGRLESTIKSLAEAGFALNTLSLVGRDFEVDDPPISFMDSAKPMQAGGRNGAFWSLIGEQLQGSAMLPVPGLGAALFVGYIVGSLEGAILGGSLGIIGGALSSVGVPHDHIPALESAIGSGHLLLIVSDTPGDVQAMRDFLHGNQNIEMAMLESTNSGRSHAAYLSRTKVRSATWWDGTWDVPTLLPAVSLNEAPVGARYDTPIHDAGSDIPGDPAVPPDAYPR